MAARGFFMQVTFVKKCMKTLTDFVPRVNEAVAGAKAASASNFEDTARGYWR
jgi:hypothetical protein